MKLIIIPMLIGFILDLIFGDNTNPYHLIRVIGNIIIRLEKVLRQWMDYFSFRQKEKELLGGVLLTILTIVSFNLPVFLLLIGSYYISIYFYYILASILCYQMIAMKDLKEESYKVYEDLVEKDIDKARYSLSMIVGRDTQILNEEEIIKATVETVAENSSDGVIAPLFYMMIMGPIGATLYKTINTLDSMVGYMNEKYQYFGRASARLDDVANFVPARLSAFLMFFTGIILKLNVKNGWKIYLRDRKKHHSPNAGQTEAMIAGLLSIQLAGDAIYKGKIKKKPFIGDSLIKIDKRHILDSHRILYSMGFMMMLLSIGYHLLIYIV